MSDPKEQAQKLRQQYETEFGIFEDADQPFMTVVTTNHGNVMSLHDDEKQALSEAGRNRSHLHVDVVRVFKYDEGIQLFHEFK